MTKYEYKILGHTFWDEGGVIGLLNREGDKGWQVVSRGPDSFLMMREIPESRITYIISCSECSWEMDMGHGHAETYAWNHKPDDHVPNFKTNTRVLPDPDPNYTGRNVV